MVHAQEDGAQLGAGDGAGVGAAVDAVNVLNGHGLHHVHFAREQGRHAGGIVADGGEHHLGHIAFDLAPVRAVAREHGAHVGLALAHPEGPSAIGLERCRVLHPLAAVHRHGGLVGLAPLLAHDVHEREHVGQDGERRLGFNLDGMAVDLAHFLEVVGVALHVRAFDLGAGQAEHHVIGGEGSAVVELHALAQLKAPHRGRCLLPAGSQHGGEAQVLVAAHQGFVDVARHAQLQGLVERVRVHRQGVALVGDAHSLRAGYNADCRQGNKQCCRGHFPFDLHTVLLGGVGNCGCAHHRQTGCVKAWAAAWPARSGSHARPSPAAGCRH